MAPELAALARTFRQLLLLLGGLQVVVAGLALWLGQLWSGRRLARERAALALQNDKQIAALTADLDRKLAATEAALTALASGHQVLHEKRLAAVSSLWGEAMRLHVSAGAGLLFFDLLLPDEYDAALRDKEILRDLVQRQRGSGRSLAELRFPRSPEVEAQLPFLPPRLWNLFTVYRQVLGRAMMLLEEGLETGRVIAWHEDKNLRQILTEVLGPAELSALTAQRLKPLAPVLERFLGLMLKEIAAALSGRLVAEDVLLAGHAVLEMDEAQRSVSANRPALP